MDYAIGILSKTNLWSSIDERLGSRGIARYSYSDLIQSWTINVLGGTTRLEHIFDHRDALRQNKKFKLGMTPDTISRAFKRLAVENEYWSYHEAYKDHSKFNKLDFETVKKEKDKKNNEINWNEKLNLLNLKTAILLGILKKDEAYELDIDATFIPTDISDSRFSFLKGGNGYSPLTVMLGGIPILSEIRNGNSHAGFRNLEFLIQCIEIIKAEGLRIKLVRSDNAGLSRKIVQYLNKENIPFYMSSDANVNKASLQDAILNFKEKVVKKATLKIADTDYMFGKEKIRIVHFKKYGYEKGNRIEKHHGIATNNWNLNNEDVIKTYNTRAHHECNFSLLKEFGWKYMPAREMKFNAVHILISNLVYLIFTYLKQFLSKKVDFVEVTMEMKTFTKAFIHVLVQYTLGKPLLLERQDEYKRLYRFL